MEVITLPTATRERTRLRFTDEQVGQANSVNLLELARMYGYVLEDKERRAYHAKDSGGLFFYKDNKTVTDALGGVSSYEYDLLGNLIKETNEIGSVTEYEYDALGRVVSVKNPLGKTDTFAYDALGRIKSVTDKNSNTTRYNYDASGNIIEAIDAMNNSSYFEYDAMNRLTKVTLDRKSVV